MASIDANKEAWDRLYDWSCRGEEWSKAWGGAEMQWFGTLVPRIRRFIPCDTILEIAPGYGRWTRFLKDWCRRLILVDLSETCIQACRDRFAACSHIDYHVNNGESLEMVGDGRLDFMFSFDSLVHAEEAVIDAYLAELSRTLKPAGAAFIHHSNLGEYPHYRKIKKKSKLRRVLNVLGLMEKKVHWRSFSMTAERMETLADRNGLRCIAQEIIAWSTKRAQIDCLSTIALKGGPWDRENRVIRNPAFMKEAEYLRNLGRLYG